MTRNVVFATCRAMPALQPDDVPIARALEALQCSVSPAPWNGPFEPFDRADLVVVRSTWDYFEHAQAFADWLQRLQSVSGEVCNAPSLMLWNSNKTYLLDLAERGAPLPPTRLCEPNTAALAQAMQELDLHEAIVKPVVGAGASGLSILRRDDPASIERAAAGLRHQGLVQPLIAEIRTLGETSCTFFGGEFSHAVVKRPCNGSILVQAEHGGQTQPAALSADQLEVARSMLELLPEPAVYARVDMVFGESAPLLMEIEVIEPELFVLHDAAAPDRFARLLLQ
jgi:glutathione synthase/RimK-type ligase-like ATP-grasp enzyme